MQLLGLLVPCIPYAAMMLSTPASSDRLMWHPAYSPLVEHAKRLLQPQDPVSLSPSYFHSSGLAWLQGIEFAAAALLLAACVRSIFFGTARSSPSAGAVPAPRGTHR